MSDPQQPAIPQSSALAEAQVESLGDLMSRDPEGYGQQELSRVIAAMREQRQKWEAAEASGSTKRERTKADTAALLKRAPGAAEDMGL